jgi:hypothetical protein
LEWKSQVVLSDKSWQGEIATHIIGFGNREPTRARRAVEGNGYLVLGAEPGNVDGVDLFDSADLENWIARYTGRIEGPRWEPHYTQVDGLYVLVVEVGPPQIGDQIFSVRKTFRSPDGNVPDGTVFVRRHGSTQRPTSTDYDMLSRRASRTGPGLDVDLVWWGDQASVRPVELSEVARAEWTARERTRLLQPIQRRPDTSALGFALLGESRSRDDYRQQVEEYLGQADSALSDEVRAHAVQAGIGRIQLALENSTEDNFELVAVELRVPGNVAAFFDTEDAFEASQFPARPLPWGARRQIVPPFNFDLPRIRPVRNHEGRIDNSASARIAFPPIHVRPAHRHALRPFNLVVSDEHAGGQIECSWYATSTSVSGTVTGELLFEIANEPVPLVQLMRVERKASDADTS